MENNQPVDVPQQPPVIQQPMQPSLDDMSKKNIKKIILIVIGVLITILLFILVMYLFMNNRSNDSSQKTLPPVSPTPITIKPTLQPFPSKGQYVEDQLIIRYNDGMSPSELKEPERIAAIQNLFKVVGVISQEAVYKGNTDPKLKNFYILHFSRGTDIKSAAKEIYTLPEVKGAEPNAKATIFK